MTDPRRKYKREWERAQPRAVCACGTILGIDSKRRGYMQCRECYEAPIREASEQRFAAIQSMWAAGATGWEIADALGYARDGIGTQIARARAAGYMLPRRKPGRRPKT